MAFETGIATGAIDYWTKLLTFLTSDATLASESGLWSIVWTAPTGQSNGIVLKGPGSSGTESILVGLARIDSSDTDSNCIRIVGMTGLVPEATNIKEHIGVSPEVRLWLDAGAMKYWFVASPRRFTIAANISTVYQAAYAGFFIPYANPLAYPYPMFIGGTSTDFTAGGVVTSWRSQSNYHAHYLFSPRNEETGSNILFRATAYMLDPTGSWLDVTDNERSPINFAPRFHRMADADGVARWGLHQTGSYGAQWGNAPIRARITTSYGEGFALEPATMIQTVPSSQTYGILEGVYYCPGVANAAENVVEINGVDHIVFQNIWRTTTLDYWALRLE